MVDRRQGERKEGNNKEMLLICGNFSQCRVLKWKIIKTHEAPERKGWLEVCCCYDGVSHGDVLKGFFYKILHRFFFAGSGGSRAARIASSKTFFKPFCNVENGKI